MHLTADMELLRYHLGGHAGGLPDRGEPLGQDGRGNRYFFLGGDDGHGGRLFVEVPPPPPKYARSVARFGGLCSRVSKNVLFEDMEVNWHR